MNFCCGKFASKSAEDKVWVFRVARDWDRREIKERHITYTPFDGFVYRLFDGGHVKRWVEPGIRLWVGG